MNDKVVANFLTVSGLLALDSFLTELGPTQMLRTTRRMANRDGLDWKKLLDALGSAKVKLHHALEVERYKQTSGDTDSQLVRKLEQTVIDIGDRGHQDG